MRRGPFHLAPIEQLDRSVLPALHYQVAAEQDRRRRAQVRVARFELRGVDRRVVAEQLGGARVELEHGVPPVAASVPGPIAGRDEDAPGGRIDDRPGAAPDGGAARRAARRIQ